MKEFLEIKDLKKALAVVKPGRMSSGA